MKAISVHKTFYKVGDFLSWYRNATLVLSPYFQRRAVWKAGTKSFLIDTIVRGLPIPIIFLRDRRTDPVSFEPIREVVDGQQRLRTVIAYVRPDLLTDFDPARDDFTVKPSHSKELAGKRFAQLPSELRDRILEYQFDVHVLPAYVDDRDVIQIFRRMNSTNYSLNAQELRNSQFFGEFKSSVHELAAEQLNRWRDWGTFTEDNIARMYEVELTSELALLILRGEIMGRRKRAIDDAYETYDEQYRYRGEVEARFRSVMDELDDRLGRDMRELPFSRRSLIYSLFACFYDLVYGIDPLPGSGLEPRSIPQERIAWIKHAGERVLGKTAPEEVLDAARRSTTNPGERWVIFEYLRRDPIR